MSGVVGWLRNFGSVAPRVGLAGDTVYVVATQVISKGVLTLVMIFMARLLSVAEFTTYTYFVVSSGILTAYLSIGLPLAASRVVSEGNQESSWASDPRIGAVIFVALAVSVAGMTMAPLYLPFLSSAAIPVNGGLIVAGALVSMWNALAQAALYANLGFKEAFKPALLGTGLSVVAAAVSAVSGSATPLIVGNIIFALVPLVLYAWHLSKRGVLPPGRFILWPGRQAISASLKIALPGLGIMLIFSTMNWAIATRLLAHQTLPDQFNQYNLGMQWVSLALFIPLGFGQAIFPRLIQAAHLRDLGMRSIAIPAGSTFLFVFTLAVVGALFTPLVNLIYGDNYVFTPVFVFTILLAGAFGGAVTLLGYFVMAARGTGTWFVINLMSVGTGVPILVLAPPQSAFEAARLLCACYVAMTIASVVVILWYRAGTARRRAAEGQHSGAADR